MNLKNIELKKQQQKNVMFTCAQSNLTEEGTTTSNGHSAL
jgi:hypothetical protein